MMCSLRQSCKAQESQILPGRIWTTTFASDLLRFVQVNEAIWSPISWGPELRELPRPLSLVWGRWFLKHSEQLTAFLQDISVFLSLPYAPEVYLRCWNFLESYPSQAEVHLTDICQVRGG